MLKETNKSIDISFIIKYNIYRFLSWIDISTTTLCYVIMDLINHLNKCFYKT